MERESMEKQIDLRLKVEEDAKIIDKVVNEIISPYCMELDKYVWKIKQNLKDGENPPTNEELEDYCLNLSAYIYATSTPTERLGMREDISKAIWKETYNTKRRAITGGTVADKDMQAQLESQDEQIINMCYSRAYKMMKLKIENAQELLSSCKKVLSHRMQEMELTRIGG